MAAAVISSFFIALLDRSPEGLRYIRPNGSLIAALKFVQPARALRRLMVIPAAGLRYVLVRKNSASIREQQCRRPQSPVTFVPHGYQDRMRAGVQKPPR
jgi:hypothetical protein